MSAAPVETLLVVGLGLIGGSVAKGLRHRRPGLRILAVDRDPEQLALARRQGVIDAGGADLAPWVGDADLIVLAVPTLAVSELLADLSAQLRPGAVVTDVASVKQPVVAAAAVLGANARRFIPGHPIAGSEKSGFGAASATLFRHRRVILTPPAQVDADAVATVHALWHDLGAEVLGMAADRHDRVLAATSHLPHLLSYGLVDVLVQQGSREDIFRYAAGGFADFSRLASSDPTVWADIFIANRAAVTDMVDQYSAHLQTLRAELMRQDRAALYQRFARAKSARDTFMHKVFHAMTDSASAATPPEVTYQVAAGGQIQGDIRVPGDKSISHRAVMFGAIAEGVTEVDGFLEGEDALNTLAAFREMGVTIEGPEQGHLRIHGVGRAGLLAPRKPLYMGNSGTAMRLLCGLLAAQAFDSELTGDASLSRRPMRRVMDPLARMGAQIEATADGTPPLRIHGGGLTGIDYVLPMASAQVKSCLLLAGLYAQGRTRVTEPAPTRDHTERMLAGFGCPVERDGASVTIQGGGVLRGTHIDVPADISSAAFFLVAASIAPGSDLTLRHVGVNPTRTGIIDLLQLMGADIQVLNPRESGGEPVADLRVRHAPLRGIDVPAALIPLAIDELPVFLVAAACAEGVTRLREAEELRVKESDRIQAMADGLAVLGVPHDTHPDGITVTGSALGSGEIDSHGDHRIAMAFTVAALRARGPLTIRDCANVATSFPGFADLARQVGIGLTVADSGSAP